MLNVTKKTLEIGEIILKRLADLNQSQRVLAQKCDVTPGCINRIILGIDIPSFYLVKKISIELDVDAKILAEAILNSL